MRLSELATETGVPVATIKYYLREGLVPSGDLVTATRAEYSAAHVERIRLIRALIEGAGVRIEGVRRVVTAIDRPPESAHDLLGVAQEAIDGPAPDVRAGEVVIEMMQRLGWPACDPGGLAHLQGALDTADRAGFPVSPARLVAYAEVMERVAVVDLDGLADDPRAVTPTGAMAHVAVGTVVTDGVLVALRRLAQAQESERRFAP